MRMVGEKTNWFWGFALTVSLSHDPIAKNSPTGEMGVGPPILTALATAKREKTNGAHFPQTRV